jgi:CheY-like chemotaxis protein
MQDARGVRERILLVEDDPDTRDALHDVLTEAGYLVECVANGQEALELVDGQPAPAAILSDIQMPGMDGTELAARMSRRCVPVILLSGRADGLVLPGVRVLLKPVSMAVLLRTVAEAVAQPTAD